MQKYKLHKGEQTHSSAAECLFLLLFFFFHKRPRTKQRNSPLLHNIFYCRHFHHHKLNYPRNNVFFCEHPAHPLCLCKMFKDRKHQNDDDEENDTTARSSVLPAAQPYLTLCTLSGIPHVSSEPQPHFPFYWIFMWQCVYCLVRLVFFYTRSLTHSLAHPLMPQPYSAVIHLSFCPLLPPPPPPPLSIHFFLLPLWLVGFFFARVVVFLSFSFDTLWYWCSSYYRYYH